MAIPDSLEKIGYFESFKERVQLSKYSPIIKTGYNYKFNIHLVINTAKIKLNVLQAFYHVNDHYIRTILFSAWAHRWPYFSCVSTECEFVFYIAFWLDHREH